MRKTELQWIVRKAKWFLIQRSVPTFKFCSLTYKSRPCFHNVHKHIFKSVFIQKALQVPVLL